VDGSTITKIADSTADTASPSALPLLADLKAIRFGVNSIITAKTLSIPSLVAAAQGGSVKLSLWRIADDGTPSPIVTDVPAGAGTSVGLLPIDKSLFVSAVVGPQGTLVLKSWKVEAVSNQFKKGTALVTVGTLNPLLPVDRVSLAGPFIVGALYYFVTAVRQSDSGTVANLLWSLDPLAGTIAAVGSFSTGIVASSVSVTMAPVESRLPDDEIFAPAYFATAIRTDTGLLEILYSAVDFDFNGFKDFSKRGDTSVTTDLMLEPPAVVPFGTSGLVTAIRDDVGRQKLIVWETRRNTDDTITPYRIAEHEVSTYDSKSIEVCSIPTTHAEGDFVSSNLAVAGGLQGSLQLRAWRIGDRP
jgi:hypothetical protein